MSNVILEEKSLSELRELYPDIKSNSQKGFIKKLKQAQPELFKQITIEEAIEEFEPPFDKDAVDAGVKALMEIEPEPIVEAPKAVAEEASGISVDIAKVIVKAAANKREKILFVTGSSQEKSMLHRLLAKHVSELETETLIIEDSRHQIHINGKAFIKCVCPTREPIAKRNFNFSIIHKVL